MEQESNSYTNCNCCSLYSHQKIGARTGGLVNKGTSWDHPNENIIKIGQNNEKSPGDYRTLCSDSNSSERLSTNANVKNSQGVK